MKFDIIYSNPPYNDNVDIKILNEIDQIFDEAIIVHPATWLLDKKNIKHFGKFKSKYEMKIKNIIYFDGHKIFNVGFMCPLSITHIDMSKASKNFKVYDIVIRRKYICQSIYDFTILGDDAKKIGYFDIIDKFKNLDKLRNHIGEKNGDFLFRLARLKSGDTFFNSIIFDEAGFRFKNSFYFYAPICKGDKNRYHFSRIKDEDVYFYFKTEEERKNFYDYLKTKIVRFILTYYKYYVSFNRFEFVPWLDFTQHWDDKKICEYFGISDKQWRYIDHLMNDLYDDYKSGFEEE